MLCGVAFAVAEDCHVQSFRAPSAYGTADSRERGTYDRRSSRNEMHRGWIVASLALLGGGRACPAGLAEEPAADREARVVAFTDLVRTRLAERGSRPQETDLPSPIVTFAVDEPDALVATLARGGVRSTAKLGRVRLGFHVYNDENDVDLVCDLSRHSTGMSGFPLC